MTTTSAEDVVPAEAERDVDELDRDRDDQRLERVDADTRARATARPIRSTTARGRPARRLPSALQSLVGVVAESRSASRSCSARSAAFARLAERVDLRVGDADRRRAPWRSSASSTGRANFAVTSVPPVNDRPSRGVARGDAVVAHHQRCRRDDGVRDDRDDREPADDVPVQATEKHASTLRTPSGSVDEVVVDDEVDEEARDEDGGEQRERGAPEQRVGEAFHRAGAEQEQHAGADDRRDVAVEDRRERAAEADLHGRAQGAARPTALL